MYVRNGQQMPCLYILYDKLIEDNESLHQLYELHVTCDVYAKIASKHNIQKLDLQ